MYVLAQFSDETSFEWLRRLRATLGKDELKHDDYIHAGLLYAGDTELWKRVDQGIFEATIYIADSHSYVVHLIPELLNSGAEFGIDFSWHDILEMASEQMIAETPAYQLTNHHVALEFADLAKGSNLLGGVLEAKHLPLPREVLQRIGGSLRHALRYAARANAVFDFRFDASDDTDGDYFWGDHPLMTAKKLEISVRTTLSTRRIFDVEDSRSVQVLTETVDALVQFSHSEQTILHIGEQDSRTADALQAADIAAGVARTAIDSGGVRSLMGKFRKVKLNGVSLDRLLR
jgi:hypothetical protein